mmetsp:Transcript_28678/g.89163  ORF Transcript_28678/g.89163 Transcript_28678/m.89163 type:complete len:516 (-) Transcript_28678:649-2196(-)
MADRSISPTRTMFQMRQDAQQKLQKMAMLGLHVFNPGWNAEGFANTNGDCTKAYHLHSGSFKEITLKVQSTGETMSMPVQVCTKVWDVKLAIANQAMVSPDEMTMICKQGCTWRVQLDTEEIARVTTVKGLKGFNPQPMKWPHTTIFIGAGYNGIKHALLWAHEGNEDYHIYDRYDQIGGHAWLVQANKTSKLQTEMGAFHVWFGTQWGTNPKLGYPVEWGTWPKKDEVIASIQHAAERYGITAHVTFKHEVRDLQVVGKLTDPDRTYKLQIEPKMKKNAEFEVTTNIVYHFPGAYFNPRVIDYPGQDESDLHRLRHERRHALRLPRGQHRRHPGKRCLCRGEHPDVRGVRSREGVVGHPEEELAVPASALLVCPPVDHSRARQSPAGLLRPSVRPVRLRQPLGVPLRVRQQEQGALHHQQPQPLWHRRRHLPRRRLGPLRVRAGSPQALHAPLLAPRGRQEARRGHEHRQGARPYRRLRLRQAPQGEGVHRPVGQRRLPAHHLCGPPRNERSQL